VNSERIQLEVWWVQPECVFSAKGKGQNLMFEGERVEVLERRRFRSGGCGVL
jgi:hypothetical protein